MNSSRRRIVIENLLPALNGNRENAAKTARELYNSFASKLADLWRYESGDDILPMIDPGTTWGTIATAQVKGRGVLLLTTHLGNWEFGAPLLSRQGIKLQVITQPEPQNKFTEARQRARARWGVETLVIGENPFAIVEVIRRLEAGAMVALLIDRPPERSATEVTLFGHPFKASIAAAELARASGCVLLPVALPKVNDRYQMIVLPEIEYDRAKLGNRAARANLTQEIIRIFEPVIRQHLSQWYHFVPLWRKA